MKVVDHSASPVQYVAFTLPHKYIYIPSLITTPIFIQLC